MELPKDALPSDVHFEKNKTVIASGVAGGNKAFRLPPHSTQDDPLLMCLVEVTRIHGTPYTAQALSTGLPLVNNKLTPTLLERAALRARFTTRIVRREIAGVPDGLLPAILLLQNNRAALLLKQLDAGRYLVQFPESSSPLEVRAEELQAIYTGFMCFVRPQFRFERRAEQGLLISIQK